jgi:hypothetical protein
VELMGNVTGNVIEVLRKGDVKSTFATADQDEAQWFWDTLTAFPGGIEWAVWKVPGKLRYRAFATYGREPYKSAEAKAAEETELAPGVVLTRCQIESWAGRWLTDEEIGRLDEAIPNSSIPSAVGSIAAALLGAG